MKSQEKLVKRADLIAAGLIRYHKFKVITPSEIAEALEILAHDLARIEDLEERLKIRARVEGFGLQIPEVDVVVHIPKPDDSEFDSKPVDPATANSLEAQEKAGYSRAEGLCTGYEKGLTFDGKSRVVHSEGVLGAQAQEKTGSSQGDRVCLGSYKGTTSLYNQEPKPTVVHTTAGHDMQETEKSGSSQDRKMCTRQVQNYMESYIRGAESKPVHQNATSNLKASRRHECEQRGPVHGRLTLAESWMKNEETSPNHSQMNSQGPNRLCTRSRWSDNGVPQVIKAAVYEKFLQGWSKSKLAREFRLNRRTVIRICRDFEAAK
jgi:hypothetical protein